MADKSDFKMIPGQEALDRLQRTLRFHPCRNDAPRTLSRSQIEQFNRDGYLKGICIFEDDEIAEHRRYFDDLLKKVLAQGQDSYSISTAHLKHGKVYDLLIHPRIVACVRDLLGENVVGWGSHYFCKMPRDGKSVTWHQDASYWPLTPSKTATVWLAVDDADRENACMQFLAGSHRFGQLAYRSSRSTEGNVLDQTVEDVERFGSPVDVLLNAGEISIHSDLLLHGSKANNSNRRRCGLTLRYCAADVRAYLDWNHKGVVVCGKDPSEHWANRSRPSAD